MFAESSPLIDFIEMRSDRCEGIELANGMKELSAALAKNPNIIIDIMVSEDRMIPASYLLHDLAEKIKKHNQNPQADCVNSLGLLYVKCSDRLVESCVYNAYDLGRCIDALPIYGDDVLKIIVSNEHQMQRILSGSLNQDPKNTLNEIVEKYPGYAVQFTDCYKRHYSDITARLG